MTVMRTPMGIAPGPRSCEADGLEKAQRRTAAIVKGCRVAVTAWPAVLESLPAISRLHSCREREYTRSGFPMHGGMTVSSLPIVEKSRGLHRRRPPKEAR